MEHIELLSMVRTAAEDVYACKYDAAGNGEQPRLPGSDQIAVNSMGIIISWNWARQSLPGRHDNVRIYTARYPSARAKDGHFQYVPRGTIPRARRYEYGFLQASVCCSTEEAFRGLHVQGRAA